jgi:hypothetical protein
MPTRLFVITVRHIPLGCDPHSALWLLARSAAQLAARPVDVTSEAGRGSRFALTLPALDTSARLTGQTKGDA